jgi:hypothetical protein
LWQEFGVAWDGRPTLAPGIEPLGRHSGTSTSQAYPAKPAPRHTPQREASRSRRAVW